MKSSLTRRQFLHGGTAVLLSAALSACGAEGTAPVSPYQTAFPNPVLESPVPPATPTESASAPEEAALNRFLALSAALTGVSPLNPVLGRVYWQSLQNDAELTMTPEALIEQVQAETAVSTELTLANLEAAGVFAQDEAQKLADKIIEYWYTGTYKDEQGETAVATFVDALAWNVLTYTKPQTICGSPYFWANHPSSVGGQP